MTCISPKHLIYKYDSTLKKKFDVKILSSVLAEKYFIPIARDGTFRTKENLHSPVGKTPFIGSALESQGYSPDKHSLVRCGTCKGCILNRSAEWAMRCVHEASLYQDNCFITLTYRNDELPDKGELRKDHVQKFWKRLRRHAEYHYDHKGIRYYYAGEYGDLRKRPHYHAIVFNWDFPDKKFYKMERGNAYYRSEMLEKIWGKGMCIIGEVSFESAAYVARYCSKKVNGQNAAQAYTRIDQQTGEVYTLPKEFSQASTRGGIGSKWFEKYWKTDLFPRDECLLNGFIRKPPRFYLKLLERTDKSVFEVVKEKREEYIVENAKHETFNRLLAKSAKIHDRFSNLVRNFEAEA